MVYNMGFSNSVIVFVELKAWALDAAWVRGSARDVMPAWNWIQGLPAAPWKI